MTCFAWNEVMIIVSLAVLPGSALANLGYKALAKKMGVETTEKHLSPSASTNKNESGDDTEKN